MIYRNLLAIISLTAGAISFILMPIALALTFPETFGPNCTDERNTINYTWPRGCR